MNKKRYKIVIVLLIAAIGVMSIRLFIAVMPFKAESTDTKQGVDYIVSREKLNAAHEENSIREMSEDEIYEKALAEGNFRKAFSNIVISGDSIVKAIAEYGYLDYDRVIAEIGGNTSYLMGLSDKIIKANPKYLVLHYGENEVESKEHAVSFIIQYKKCITHLKEKLPGTKIFVESIFPVTKKACTREPNLVNIAYYNTKLKKMAEELGVNYLDYTQVWKKYPKYYYDADGIHPIGIYYSEQYLPYIFAEVRK